MLYEGLKRLLSLLKVVAFHVHICVFYAHKLSTVLFNGTRTWILMLFRLLSFTLVLIPGWFRLLRYWFFDSFIIRNVEYGKGSEFRNLIDIYLPHKQQGINHDSTTPVIIFVSGGAWIIGYKLWSALVGRGLSTIGLLVIVPDYRNFPQGDIGDMVDDIRNALKWTEANASTYGGDPNRIILAGQSAGAHICLSLIVKEFFASQTTADSDSETQSPCKSSDSSCINLVKLFIGVSGPYNLHSLMQHLHHRGLDSSILGWICRGNISAWSPTEILQELTNSVVEKNDYSISNSNSDVFISESPLQNSPSSISPQNCSGIQLIDSDRFHHRNNNDEDDFKFTNQRINALSGCLNSFPPIALFHGSSDQTIPSAISKELATVVALHGGRVKYIEYDGWSHTDAILEAPLSGNSRLFEDIHRILENNCEFNTHRNKFSSAQLNRLNEPFVSRALVDFARSVNPF